IRQGWTSCLTDTQGGCMIRSIVFASVILAGAATVVSAQDAAARGQQLFIDQKCTLCHAVAGKGNPKGPLDGVGSKQSSADIRAWLTDAKAMTAKTKATRTPAMKQYTLPKED